ncbi:MAG: hypothetical protein WCO66_04705 [Candidatus Absconditabacteria bacterium]
MTNGTIGRVAVRYPDRIRITAELDKASSKWYGICDEMHNGEKVMTAFKMRPLYDTEEEAKKATDDVCKKIIVIYQSWHDNPSL